MATEKWAVRLWKWLMGFWTDPRDTRTDSIAVSSSPTSGSALPPCMKPITETDRSGSGRGQYEQPAIKRTGASPVPATAAPIAPIDIGGRFSTLPGAITSTLMDGPGVALDSGAAFDGLVEVRAASLVGDLHVEEGSRRQDAYAVRISEMQRLINVAVCDGVGSRHRSNEGAAAIATGVVRHAAQGSPDPVDESVSRLLRMAENGDVPQIEYSTTLIWVRVEVGRPAEPWSVGLVQYGDGDVRFLGSDSLWKPVDRQRTASEADIDSFALPLATRPGRRARFRWHPDQVLVLATDGLSDHLDSRTKVGHFLAKAWQSPPDRWMFLSQVAFRAVGAGDDRTAIALWRTDGAAAENVVPECSS